MSAIPFVPRPSARRSRWFTMALASVIFATANAGAGLAEDGESFQYEDLEALALKHNPDLKSSFQRWQAALAKVTVARSLPDPTLTYTEFVEEVQTRVGPQRRKLALMQMFPWFGTLGKRKDAALARAEGLSWELEDQALVVVERVRENICDLLLLEKKMDIRREHLDIAQSLETSAMAGLSSNRAHLSDVLRIQVEKDALEDQIQSLAAIRAPLLQKLESQVGVSLSRPIPTAWPAEKTFGKAEAFEARYKAQHPQWQAVQKAIDVAEAEVALARKKGMPDLGLGMSWVDTGEAFMPGTAGSGDDPLALTLSMSLPLWRGKVQSDIQSRMSDKAAIESKQESLLQTFRFNLQQALFQANDSQRKIVLYRDSILPKAQAAALSALKGHESNLVSFQNVLDAQRVLLRFSLDLQQALRDRAVAQIRLERLTGPSTNSF